MDMPDKEREAWGELFARNPDVFGAPLKIVVESLLYLKKGDSVLDLGAGYGRHARLLALRGMQVEAVDQDEDVIKELEAVVRTRHLPLEIQANDITRMVIAKHYHMILCTFVLHLISKDETLQIIKKIKERTFPGGVNTIAVWMTQGELYNLVFDSELGFFDSGELRTLYQDWLLLHYNEEERDTIRYRGDGSRMRNMSAHLIAKRP